jgi:hypothetical protein
MKSNTHIHDTQNAGSTRLAAEGYIYVVYGKLKYMRDAIASVVTLRRYDTRRPVALVCQPAHKQEIEKQGLSHLFDHYVALKEGHDSIVGFKHNVDQYLVFERNLFLDSDIVWCRNPDPLWSGMASYPYTITGALKADYFFGAPKGLGIIRDVLFRRRERTLQRFGLSYLSRVQSGMIYASDESITRKVCALATEMLSRIDETHFQSRRNEAGRTLESCEWSLAMAMSKLNLPVFNWQNGHESPQLDYISDIVNHDKDFKEVSCTFHTHPFVYSLRGIKADFTRRLLYRISVTLPGFGDYQTVIPYVLHFGWLHQKEPFNDFAKRTWNRLTSDTAYENAKPPA